MTLSSIALAFAASLSCGFGSTSHLHADGADPDSALLIDPAMTAANDPTALTCTVLPGSRAVTIEFVLDGLTRSLELTPDSIRHPDFKLVIQDGPRTFRQVDAQPSGRYTGGLSDVPDSRASMHRGPDGWNGMIDDGSGLSPIYIQPHPTSAGEHLVTRGSWDDAVGTCEVGVVPDNGHQGFAGSDSGGATADQTLLLTIDVDRAYSQLLGNDPQAILSDVESVLSSVALIMIEDVGVELVLASVVVRDDDAVYPSTTASGLLCDAMRAWKNEQNRALETNVVQVFTGRPLSGIVGFAYLETACPTPSSLCGIPSVLANKNVVASRYSQDIAKRIALSAHEIAHNIGARHCGGNGCSIMCSSIGFCDELNENTIGFGAAAIEDMQDYLESGSASCLQDWMPSVSPPLSDSFENGLDSQMWEFATEAISDTNVGGEPDGIKSCRFRRYQADEEYHSTLISRRIDMSSRTNGRIDLWVYRFYAQNSFPGNPLVVSGLDRSGQWQELVRYDTSRSTWHNRSITIPDTLMWSGLRIRFQANLADYQGEYWLIDMVEITASGTSNLANDECTGAFNASQGWNPLTTSGASDSGTVAQSSCVPGANPYNDVWFVHDSTCTGRATVSTCGSTTFDSRIRAYRLASGDSCTTGLVEVGCSYDDPCTGVPGDSTSFDTIDGERYLFRIGSTDGTSGLGGFVLECTPEATCTGDYNDDGVIDGIDLGILLGSWNGPAGDLNGDGTVDGIDLSLILGGWGNCQ